MNKIALRNRILLSFQTSLLGYITPEILAVLCKWNDTKIDILFVLSEAPSEEVEEDISCVETEMFSHFDELDINVSILTKREASPAMLDQYIWAYRSKNF